MNSKEQTPITAREFIPKNDNGLYSRRQVEKHAEEYAQAKVLEALEREFSKLDGIDFTLIGGIEYYETEVKPKYE